jgi:hypothetical protein
VIVALLNEWTNLDPFLGFLRVDDDGFVRLNVDQLMWSTDYPHTGSDWPSSRITIERNFRGVPKTEVKKMLHDNCRRLYKLDHVPDTLTEG